MRLVHVTVDLKEGGLENQFAHIVTGQRNRGYEVRAVCLTSGGETADRLRDEGIPVEVVEVQRVHPGSLLKVRRSLLRSSPEIAHLHGMPAGTFGRIALIGTGARTVYQLYTFISIAHRMTSMRKVRERWLALEGGAILAVSEAVKRDLVEEVGLPARRIMVPPGGYGGVPDLPHPGREKIRRRLGLSASDKAIVCLASLTRHKGHATLLEAMARIPGVLLLLGGEGPEREAIEARIARPDLAGRVRLLGFVEDAPALLAACDVATLASYPREGLPLSIMETHRAGRPSVVTNVGGMPEIVVDGVTGIVVEPNNPEVLAKALGLLLEDAELREKMGRAARERFLERYELNRYLDRLEQIYQGKWG